jgi:drug/metabolite transporter superfamily protein YnfA
MSRLFTTATTGTLGAICFSFFAMLDSFVAFDKNRVYAAFHHKR